MTDSFKYQGHELELFQHAQRWKKYFSQQIKPLLNGMVLEVGAGLGATTLLLNNGSFKQWVLLEPDEEMSRLLQQKKAAGELPGNCQLQKGTIDGLAQKFDTIIYIDVLEHIEEDKEERKKAAALLNPGGHIIVLSPAFQFLYSPFDKAIGHFRRYNKTMVRQLTPAGLHIVSNKYYDSVGYFAGLMNKLLLRQQYPTLKQVLFWDRWMVPVSKLTDHLVFHQFGKSIICIWEKTVT
jgi:2-polyprenyl-3-methyl-5-hydroxy-6-metoxy-1,4-benzoquinol methylase